ncbi:hypothetical protein GCM10018771_14050 [Streptomyces cellulosae]|nr:hypothetical protein GCM10018771_14050 [Streptomyces cellulosae]
MPSRPGGIVTDPQSTRSPAAAEGGAAGHPPVRIPAAVNTAAAALLDLFIVEGLPVRRRSDTPAADSDVRLRVPPALNRRTGVRGTA